jgi:DNA-binding transcriptional MerR regulator
MEISIGELSRRTGVKTPTIRYYESVALMPSPSRNEGRQRRYGESEVSRLTFIRHARDLGFGIDAIRELLAMSAQPEQSCAEADRIARRHMGEVDRRISQLVALRAELQRMVDACGHGRVGDCRVIETLANHMDCFAVARKDGGGRKSP